MKTILSLSVFLVLVLAAKPCLAEIMIEDVSKERAKELGMTIRSTPGTDSVRVELEFRTDGALKGFSHVELDISEGGKTVVSSTLREDRSKPQSVVVWFAADRANLDKITLMVVVTSERRLGGSGYQIRVKDHVDLAKPR